MPNPKSALQLIEAAKKAYKAKFTPGFYHASGASDIKEFIPSHRGATFVTKDPGFSESFHPIDEAASGTLNSGFAYKTGATTYPLSVNLGKHFDVDTPEGRKFVEEFLKKQPSYFPHKLENFLGDQSWASVEAPEFSRALKKAGYDTFSIKEGGVKNVGVFNPKNIRGKFAEFNPENAESADFMKAEGGKINPIKTPREMLFEMAGLTFMAGGGKAGAGAEMYKLITQAIERYTKTYGKPPNPEDVKALKEHAKQLSVKPEIKTDPTTQARARHEMATDPNLINPEGPDPFLTKATTGRTVKSTYLKPKVQDINDPNVRQNIEVKQAAGELEEVLPESTTPSADYMARMSKGIENETLASGKTPLIDKLKASFFAKYKRYPTDDELESIIAEFNPARHQYGEKGPSIVTERPPTAKGMAEWKAKARLEGIPEAYIEKTPGNYPKYLQDELQLGKGIQPGTKPLPETRINPDRQYAGGNSVAPMSPAEMQAMMFAYGKTPNKFMPESKMEKIMRGVSVPAAAMSAHMAGQKLTEGDPYEAALYGASALGSGMAASRKFLKPGLGIAGAAAVPLSVDEAIRRYKKGDRTGAVIAAIEAAGNAAAIYPPTAIPGSIVSFGAGMANAFRGEPEQKSVMEDYK